MKSVINQTTVQIEYIVIDGGSSDGTQEIITKYILNIDKFISEPDKGIYDAMNKGISLATGSYILFVNSGDVLSDNFVIQNFLEIPMLERYDMIYGKAKKVDATGAMTDLRVGHAHPELWKGPYFRHGALFAKAELLKNNLFEISERLKIAADYDFIYKMLKKSKFFFEVNFYVVNFLEDGVSNNIKRHLSDSIFLVKKYGDWNRTSQVFYIKKYIKSYLSRSWFGTIKRKIS